MISLKETGLYRNLSRRAPVKGKMLIISIYKRRRNCVMKRRMMFKFFLTWDRMKVDDNCAHNGDGLIMNFDVGHG